LPFDPPATDDALLAAYAAGDPAAARVLVGRLAPRILRLARRLLTDPAEAEDVTQEALLRLWQIAPRWQAQGASPATWLHRVAVNLATDRLRRRRATGLDQIDEPEDGAAPVVETMIAADRLAALDEALAQLPDRQRAAVVLRHLEGMTNPEIAAQLDVGVEAVESLTARGKRRLAQLLADRRDELGFDR
jgi:RNA polymerase sigma-70 factor, ECF subfamily